MLGKIIMCLFGLVMALCFGMFLLLSIDIVDGRDMHLVASPLFKADTSTAALAIALMLVFLSAFLIIAVILFSKTNKTNQL